MTFKKPKNISYTEMAIWIDENAYLPDCDDSKLFEYLYHLVEMLAYKRAFFKSTATYDEFSIITATRIYYRLRNKDQFVLLENGTPKLTQVKSILNYIKKTIYLLKVKYEQEAYSQANPYTLEDQEKNAEIQANILINNYKSSKKQLTQVEVDDYISSISKIIRDFLKKIPHKNNSNEFLNIYTSCLLSFLNLITLSNKNKKRFKSFLKAHVLNDNYINSLYKEEQANYIILYHLDESMHDYINILVNEIKFIIINDILNMKNEYDNQNDLILDLIYKNIEDKECK